MIVKGTIVARTKTLVELLNIANLSINLPPQSYCSVSITIFIRCLASFVDSRKFNLFRCLNSECWFFEKLIYICKFLFANFVNFFKECVQVNAYTFCIIFSSNKLPFLKLLKSFLQTYLTKIFGIFSVEKIFYCFSLSICMYCFLYILLHWNLNILLITCRNNVISFIKLKI